MIQVSGLVLLLALFLTTASLWLLVKHLARSPPCDPNLLNCVKHKVVEQLYLEKAGWREAPALATLAALVNYILSSSS